MTRDASSPPIESTHDRSESPPSPSYDQGDGAGRAGKPGRKKNPNAQTARRDQNRLAQRQFRMRKQQRIRDLEARVELLSSSREDSFKELRLIMQDLIKENATLRQLVKDLAAFLGNSEGGFLPRLGWSWDEFSSFVDRAETDTAFESFASRRRKESGQETETNGKRRSEDEPEGSTSARKRSRLNEETSSHSGTPFLYSNVNALPRAPWTNVDANEMVPMARPASDRDLYSPFGTLIGDTAPSTDFHIPPKHPNELSAPLQPIADNDFLPSQYNDSVSSVVDENFPEAMKLVKYHLENYRRNEAYCLPPSLRPSLVQRTVPHESVLDELVNPDLRDSMILLRNRYDLIDCLHGLAGNIRIHGDDVLSHANWEFKEPWLRKWPFLVEQPFLDVCNRWRRERGEPDLSLSELRGKGKEK